MRQAKATTNQPGAFGRSKSGVVPCCLCGIPPVWQGRRRTGSSASSLRCCTSATSSSQARRSLAGTADRPQRRMRNPMGRNPNGARRHAAWLARYIAVLHADGSTARGTAEADAAYSRTPCTWRDGCCLGAREYSRNDSTARSGRGRRCVHGSCARRLRERAARLRAQGARAGAQTTAPFIRARCALRSRHRRAKSARPPAAGARLCCASPSLVRCPCVSAAPRALPAAASTARERFGSRRRFASA